jgi:DNA-binding transcriptional ArsR family regulator
MENAQATIALSALGHEPRLNIFRLIVQRASRGVTPTEIIECLGIPAATLSFHLKELTHAGLIRSVREGRQLFYSPEFHFVNELISFISENCCDGQPCDLVRHPKKTPKQGAGHGHF